MEPTISPPPKVPDQSAFFDSGDDAEDDGNITFEPLHVEDDQEPTFSEGPLDYKEPSTEPVQIHIPGLSWAELDITQPDALDELREFLYDNYVEDTSGEFRFDYSAACLSWALVVPGYHPEWHVALRSSDGTLVAFAGGIPLRVRVRDQ